MTTGDGTEPAGGGNSPEDFGSRVFTFLSAIGGVSAEEERAHLIATQLSSVVPCAVAGVALVDNSGHWAITWQMKGQPLEASPELIEQLEPLRQRAAEQATLLVATREGGPAAVAVPPLLEALRVRRLAVSSLRSSHHDFGVLFAGREAGRPFSPEEQLALLAIAQQAAVGIDNLRLTEELRRHSQSLERQSAVISQVEALKEQLEAENLSLQEEIRTRQNSNEVIGPSPAIGQVLQAIETVTDDVRELMHVIERGVLTAPGERLRSDFPVRTRDSATGQGSTTREVLTETELQRAHDDNLRAALLQTGWKIYGPGGTAELLGMQPTTLTARIKKAGLQRPPRPGRA